MSNATFTFRVDSELKREFSKVAKSHDRSGAQLLRDFMREYTQQQQSSVEHDSWFREQVTKGIASANRGNLRSNEDVESRFAARRAITKNKLDNA